VAPSSYNSKNLFKFSDISPLVQRLVDSSLTPARLLTSLQREPPDELPIPCMSGATISKSALTQTKHLQSGPNKGPIRGFFLGCFYSATLTFDLMIMV
jgi:hypothetical protein